MKCERCGADLVAPEEMNAHARGACDGLEVPPPPDLGARIRHARQLDARKLELKDLAFRRRQRKASVAGGKVRAENSAPDFATLERVARRYRRGRPYEPNRDGGTRQMARDLAAELDMPFGTVRDRLRKLGIK